MLSLTGLSRMSATEKRRAPPWLCQLAELHELPAIGHLSSCPLGCRDPVQRFGMPSDSPKRVLSRLLFGKPIERLDREERADLEHLLSLDDADEELYERLASEYPEEDGYATRH